MGSSASRIVGRVTSARAIATRCCSPPESSEGGAGAAPAGRPSSSSSSTHALSGFSPAIESGSTMFSSASSIGSRLKNWKTNPMCSRRSSVSSASSRFVMSVPAIVTEPGVGLSRPGEQVHQRRLAGARRAHHGHELAVADADVHSAQRVHGGLALAVDPREVVGDDRGLHGGGGGGGAFRRGSHVAQGTAPTPAASSHPRARSRAGDDLARVQATSAFSARIPSPIAAPTAASSASCRGRERERMPAVSSSAIRLTTAVQTAAVIASSNAASASQARSSVTRGGSHPPAPRAHGSARGPKARAPGAHA